MRSELRKLLRAPRITYSQIQDRLTMFDRKFLPPVNVPGSVRGSCYPGAERRWGVAFS